MSDNNSSTFQSYVDSASGTVHNALGKVTGSSGDQAQGQARKDQAKLEHDASHATAKVPGATLSGSGAATRDDPNRTEGSWNQTVGSAKETLGNLVGNEVSFLGPLSLATPLLTTLTVSQVRWPSAEPRGSAAGGQGSAQRLRFRHRQPRWWHSRQRRLQPHRQQGRSGQLRAAAC
jgi:uncharacterized protein YjbJ (UPF0337 family)